MTHIEAQALGAALRSLAKEHGLQVLVSSELVRDIRTSNVDGEMTTEIPPKGSGRSND